MPQDPRMCALLRDDESDLFLIYLSVQATNGSLYLLRTKHELHDSNIWIFLRPGSSIYQ